MSCRLKNVGYKRCDSRRGRDSESRVGVSNFERCPFLLNIANPYLAMETRLMDVLKKVFGPFYMEEGLDTRSMSLGCFLFKSKK